MGGLSLAVIVAIGWAGGSPRRRQAKPPERAASNLARGRSPFAAPGRAAGNRLPPGALTTPELTVTLREFLTQVSDRMLEVRQLDLRRTEAEAELAHVRQSRAFEVDMRGQYREEDFHRVEVNGGNVKSGRTEDIRRTWTFRHHPPAPRHAARAAAHRRQRTAADRRDPRGHHPHQTRRVPRSDRHLRRPRRRATALEPLRERAIALERERVRILEARHRSGEACARMSLPPR